MPVVRLNMEITVVDINTETNVPEATPPTSFTVAHQSFAKNKDAVLALGAPYSLWRERRSWLSDECPCPEMQIKFGPKKGNTPILQRLRKHHDKAAKFLHGNYRYAQDRLETMLYMPILEGELRNQEVLSMWLGFLVSKWVRPSATSESAVCEVVWSTEQISLEESIHFRNCFCRATLTSRNRRRRKSLQKSAASA